MCLVDYSTAFDNAQHSDLWRIMRQMDFPRRPITLLCNIYQTQHNAERTECGTSDWFDVTKGVRQGCPLSRVLFNIYTEQIWPEIDARATT